MRNNMIYLTRDIMKFKSTSKLHDGSKREKKGVGVPLAHNYLKKKYSTDRLKHVCICQHIAVTTPCICQISQHAKQKETIP